jgi:Phosphatidylinositol-4-phosphate 5-kinase
MVLTNGFGKILFLNDNINSWIDTINLKLLVNNPSLYQYRVYAYADTNTSYRRTIKIQPALPGHPGSVSPYEISYTHEPAKKMTIKYQQSNELDFYRYNIYHSKSQDGEKSIFISIYNSETTVLDTNNFSVLQENWFWVEVEDTTNQKTLGNPLGIPVDSPPIPAVLDSIIYDSKQFVFSWSQSIDNDIGEYVIEQVSPTDTSIVNQSLSLDNNTLSTAIDVAIDNEHYYRLRTSDVWGNNSYSRIRPSSSFQKIVKLDTVTENGNDLIIMNLGPSLPFTQTLANVKSQFPLWIQNGKKIFSLR